MIPFLCSIALVVAACGHDAIDTTTTQAPTTTSEATTTTVVTTTLPDTTTTTGVPAPVTTHVGLPAALSRSLIPLDHVDAGWVAALYAADTQPTDLTTPMVEGPIVLYVVDPAGPVYEVAAFTDPSFRPWHVGGLSNDGRRVLLLAGSYPDFTRSILTVDIETGAVSTVLTFPDGAVPAIGFTLPTGRDVVVQLETAELDRIDVYRTSGTLFAAIDSKTRTWPSFTWLYGLAGTELVVGDGVELTVRTNQGAAVRTIGPDGSCRPVRWWDQATVLAACVPPEVVLIGGLYEVLWLVPVDGSAPTRITALPPSDWDVVDFGHADAWVAGDRTLLQWWGDCAARGVERLHPDGTAALVPIEAGGEPWIVAIADDFLVIHAGEGCGWEGGSVILSGPDGSLVRVLVPQVTGYTGVVSVAGMIPVQ
jgi:hypothetical protein